MPSRPPTSVSGSVDDRFRAVRDAFANNLEAEDEIGAAVCIRLEGRVVVDIWGGHADLERTRPWERDTLVNAYSVGKGVLAALCLAVVERGDLDLDAPIAARWPEFAAHGKGEATLRSLLGHRAGLPAIRERLPAGAQYDWTRVCDSLAAQAPYWEPGRHHGYHVNTFGFLVGELVRRATGRPVGEALRELVTGPLEADYFWGVPEALHTRISQLCSVDANLALHGPDDWSRVFPPTGDDAHDEMIWHAYFNPPGISGSGTVNTREWRLAAIPSTNGHGTARAVSAIYAALLETDGPAALIGRDLLREARESVSDGDDVILNRPSRFGLGFQLAQPTRPLGRSPQAFGHYGYGGALGFADPEAHVGFGYVMNRPGERWQTPRTQALVDAFYASL